jgi:hypothetical protein
LTIKVFSEAVKVDVDENPIPSSYSEELLAKLRDLLHFKNYWEV